MTDGSEAVSRQSADFADQVLRSLLSEVLGLPEFGSELTDESRLLGTVPELDSMAIAALVVGMEQACDLELNDGSLNAGAFETFGSLKAFLAEQLHLHGRHPQQVL